MYVVIYFVTNYLTPTFSNLNINSIKTCLFNFNLMKDVSQLKKMKKVLIYNNYHHLY